jgi:hypothetical protein
LMCEMCDENGGEPTACPNCGRLICLDFNGFDDVMSRAVGDCQGDLSCIPCSRRTQEEEDERAEEECYEPPYDVP